MSDKIINDYYKHDSTITCSWNFVNAVDNLCCNCQKYITSVIYDDDNDDLYINEIGELLLSLTYYLRGDAVELLSKSYEGYDEVD